MPLTSYLSDHLLVVSWVFVALGASLALVRRARQRDPDGRPLGRPGVLGVEKVAAGVLVLGFGLGVELVSQRVAALPVLPIALGLGVVVAVLVAVAVPSAPQGSVAVAVVVAAAGLAALGTLESLRLEQAVPPARDLVVAAVCLLVVAAGSTPRAIDLLERVRNEWLGLAAVLLVALPLLTLGRVNGAFIDFRLPYLGSLQPGEIGRVLLVVWLARRLDIEGLRLGMQDRRVLGVPLPAPRTALVLLFPAVLAAVLAVVSNDLGPAALVVVVSVAMLAASGAGVRYVVASTVAGAAALAVLVQLVPKAAERVAAVGSSLTSSGELDQVDKGIVAAAHGGTTGLGIGQGLPASIPNASTDLVLPALAEEQGFLTLGAIVVMQAVVLLFALGLARRLGSGWQRLVTVGLATLVTAQAVFMWGGVSGRLPLTGMPVAWLSASGSSRLGSALVLALLLGLARGAGATSSIPPASASRLAAAHVVALPTVLVLMIGLVHAGLGRAEVLEAAGNRDARGTRLDLLASGAIVSADGTVLAETVVADGPTLRPATGVRRYPAGDAFSAVVGHRMADGTGAGLDRGLSDVLACDDRERLTADLLAGCPVVRLTIRDDLQLAAARLLDGRVGAVVVTEVASGDIVAYVSSPSAVPAGAGDPLPDVVGEADTDLVAGSVTMPGSVAKLATSVAALTTPGVVLPTTPAGSYVVEGSSISSASGYPCGGRGIADSLSSSCNPTFADLGSQLGARTLGNVTEPLLNQQTKVDGIHIAHSSLVSDDDYATDSPASRYDTAAGAIGVGNAQASPFAIAQLTTQIARGGEPVALHLVANPFLRPPGGALRTDVPTLPAGVTEEIAQGMRQAVVDGTASGVVGLEDVEAAAKTGTADIREGYNNAWFSAFAPYSAPKYAVTVLIAPSDPDHTDLVGSIDAGPVAAELLRVAIGIDEG